jgi:hypothetical protein
MILTLVFSNEISVLMVALWIPFFGKLSQDRILHWTSISELVILFGWLRYSKILGVIYDYAI